MKKSSFVSRAVAPAVAAAILAGPAAGIASADEIQWRETSGTSQHVSKDAEKTDRGSSSTSTPYQEGADPAPKKEEVKAPSTPKSQPSQESAKPSGETREASSEETVTFPRVYTPGPVGIYVSEKDVELKKEGLTEVHTTLDKDGKYLTEQMKGLYTDYISGALLGDRGTVMSLRGANVIDDKTRDSMKQGIDEDLDALSKDDSVENVRAVYKRLVDRRVDMATAPVDAGIHAGNGYEIVKAFDELIAAFPELENSDFDKAVDRAPESPDATRENVLKGVSTLDVKVDSRGRNVAFLPSDTVNDLGTAANDAAKDAKRKHDAIMGVVKAFAHQ